MRLFFILFTVIAMGFTSCDSGKTDNNEMVTEAEMLEETDDFERFDNWDTLQGSYIADFGDSKIRINVDYINPFKVVGYNIHKGLQRNLSGDVSEDENFVHIKLNEPGDHEYDGVFDLHYDKLTGVLTGSWEPNSTKLKSKTLNLHKVDSENETIDWNGKEMLTVESFVGIFNGASNVEGNEKYIYFEEGGRMYIEYYESLDTLNRSVQMERIVGVWFVEKEEVFVEFSENNMIEKGLHKVTISKSEEEEYYPPMLTFNDLSFMPEYY